LLIIFFLTEYRGNFKDKDKKEKLNGK
jgi:hypothetical protein